MGVSNHMAKKYYLMYLRKSSESDERQAQSLADQEKDNRALASRLNLDILKTFSESKSSKQPGREEFNKMLALINERQDIKGILAWHYNRLSRNPIDSGTLQWLLQQGLIEEIVTTERTFSAEDSALLMALEGGMSNQFILDLRKAVKRGLDSKIDKGIAPVFAPVGYLNDKNKPKGMRDIIPHPDYFPLMRKLFEQFMTGGYSVLSLVKIANEIGLRNNRGKRISKTSLYCDLQNPFYTGKFMYNGKMYDGIHQAMLTESEFLLIQDIIHGNSKPRPQKPLDFPLNGFVKCGECGMSFVGERHIKQYKNGSSHEFRHYRCTKKSQNTKCGQKYIKVAELEKQVAEYLTRVEIDSEYGEWAAYWCNYLTEQERTVREAHKSSLQKVYGDAVIKIDSLLDLKISTRNANGSLLSEGDYQVKREKLIIERDKAKEDLEKLDKQSDEWDEMTVKTFDFATKAKQKFETGDTETKKLILRGIGSYLTLTDGILNVQPRIPFLAIKNHIEQKKQQKFRLVPDKNTVYSAQFATLPSEIDTVRNRRGSNPRPRP
jgi:DNA invertase Pin-like site-specific DNA recombinase